MRLGALVTFLGAMFMLVVVLAFQDNKPLAFLAFVIILVGVVMRR